MQIILNLKPQTIDDVLTEFAPLTVEEITGTLPEDTYYQVTSDDLDTSESIFKLYGFIYYKGYFVNKGLLDLDQQTFWQIPTLCVDKYPILVEIIDDEEQEPFAYPTQVLDIEIIEP